MKNFIIICLIGYIFMNNVYGLDSTHILNYVIDISNKIVQLIATIILSM